MSRSPSRDRSASRAGRTLAGSSGGGGAAPDFDASAIGGGTLCDWYKTSAITNASPVVSAATASTTAGGWPASNLNDGLYGDGGSGSWSASAAAPQWVKFQYGSALTIGSYRIHARTSAQAQAPTAWTLEGSNDDSAWTTLDTRSSQTWSSAEYKTFTVATPGSYLYYRLNMSATSSGNPSFAELRMFLSTGQGTLIDAFAVADQTANSHNYTTVLGSQAVLTSGGPNSQPWGDYSGGAGGMTGPGATPVPTGDLTYFGVIKPTSSSVQSLIGTAGGGGAQLRLNAYKLELDRDAVAQVAISTITFTTATWAIFIVTYTKATGSTTFRIGSQTETIAGTSGVTWTSPGTLRALFNHGSTASNQFSGGWAEIGRYTSVLSGPDQATLLAGLQAKYAL